jgi:MoxR-like ATPase
MDFEQAIKLTHELRNNLGKVVKGHETGVNLLIITLMAKGHVLLESVPGEGKTLLATALAASIDGMTAGRISGQPTLKPSDLLGAEIAAEGTDRFELIKGPIFNNIVLFDELNRTDPRTQSALLEAMQEYQVTIGTASHKLPQPFHVIATQNPLSHEGTWELDAAAKQRFMVKIEWTFSPKDIEFQIAREAKASLKENLEKISPVINRYEFAEIQDMIQNQVELSDSIVHLMNSVTVATRRSDPSYPTEIFDKAGLGREVITPAGGASSRTTSFWPPFLRAHAFFHGRKHVVPYDVFASAVPILNHRLETSYPVDTSNLINLILSERGYAYKFNA